MRPLDLTHTISTKLPSFPGSPTPKFIPLAKKKTDGYNLELLFFSSHTGTHIDAPFHFIDKSLKIDKIPIHRFICNAILCRIKKKSNQPITTNDIIQFEKKYCEIPPRASIVFATGWDKNLFKNNYFDNPGLSKSAAKYLASKKINLVGIDSPSIDLGKDSDFSAHHILLKNNILILENLCNLEKVPGVKFKLIVLPLKLKGATGAPVRAIAV
ncbi:MAG: Cyclase [Nitrosopumilales archaeon]|nr:MAG: Cyclase [Nitrosopumilales archaeon]